MGGCYVPLPARSAALRFTTLCALPAFADAHHRRLALAERAHVFCLSVCLARQGTGALQSAVCGTATANATASA